MGRNDETKRDRSLCFLAGMSSSRSNVVTQSAFSFICPLFFSFSALGVLSSPKEFQWCSKKVLRVFEVSRILQVSLMGAYKKCQGCFKKASRVFQGSFRESSRVFQESFKGVSSKIEGCFKGI